MVTVVHLKGMDEFNNYVENMAHGNVTLLCCFTGEKLPSGRSWCSDCNEGCRCLELEVLKKPEIKRNDVRSIVSHSVEEDKVTGKNPDTFFLFTGKKKENGRSWCMHCQIAEPVIEAFLTEVKRKIIFAFVDVGDKDTWRDKNCPFRTDKRTKLMVIPTIIRWNGVQRLEGSQCGKRELLQMLIEEEED